ncbi:MAG: hypothetical protein LQ350_003706 [Teloschistes chrysophthalmus]|nr:MAG: hypothetical protein LQ350_003706 [Niorma chrysophthalma]
MYHHLILLLTLYLHLTSALTTPPIQRRCRPKPPQNPPLNPQSCTIALNALIKRYPSPTYDFSAAFIASPQSLKLPLRQTHEDCTIKLNIFYVFRVRESMSRVVAAVDEVIEDCVGGRRFSGGSREVGATGLWVDVVPSVIMGGSVVDSDRGNGTAIS